MLDIALPRLGECDVIRELRLNPATRSIPIVIVTGLNIPDLSERTLVPVLKKPVDDRALVRAVEDLLHAGDTSSAHN